MQQQSVEKRFIFVCPNDITSIFTFVTMNIYSKCSLLTLAVGSMTLAGCSSKMKDFKSEYFSCNPQPLEVVGQNVPATVTARVPQKFFVKNAELTVTPTLKFANGELKSAPVMFEGEKVRGNYPTISYDNGGTMTIPVNYVYQPEMRQSELYLDFNVRQGNKQYVLPSVKVADGVIATAALSDAGTVTPAAAADKYQRIVNEKYKADIHFLINQANVRSGETNSEGMNAFNSDLKKAAQDTARVIEEINISSYASPEGSLEFNTQLAENRETNTSKYLNDQLKKDKISSFGELTAQFTPEDWEGFQELVAASDIQDKQLILSVLSMYKDPAQREQEIRNMSSIFDQLAETILPKLRRSRLTASVNVIGRSDEQINEAFDKNPKVLSVDELLYAANLTNDKARKQAIYETAIAQYPSDYRAYNNLGNLYYAAGEYEKANAQFNKAKAINPTAKEIAMNEALLALVNKDMQTAQQKLGQAADVEGLGGALGTYYLMEGNNDQALRAFGDTQSNNAALAQILNKNYSAAQRILNNITPDATTYYLKAIVGARTNNEAEVMTNLRKAISLDRNLASQAATDLEFASFNLSKL